MAILIKNIKTLIQVEEKPKLLVAGKDMASLMISAIEKELGWKRENAL